VQKDSGQWSAWIAEGKWPNLDRQSGREEPEDLICPVCDTLFDSRPGKAKHSPAGPGGKFTGGYDPSKAGSYHHP